MSKKLAQIIASAAAIMMAFALASCQTSENTRQIPLEKTMIAATNKEAEHETIVSADEELTSKLESAISSEPLKPVEAKYILARDHGHTQRPEVLKKFDIEKIESENPQDANQDSAYENVYVAAGLGDWDGEDLLSALKATGEQGTKGRLIFKELDMSMALYLSDQDEGPDAQTIVNEEDSAVWFMWFGCKSPIIADHSYQGFEKIKESQIGDTCYILYGDSYQVYRCRDTDPNAINELNNLLLSDGSNIMRENNPGFLYMYTCNEDWEHVTVVTWVPVES